MDNTQEIQLYTVLLGKKLRNLRTQKGWSIREMNRRSKICIATITDLENGKVLPSIRIIHTLFKTLGANNESIIPSVTDYKNSTSVLEQILAQMGLNKSRIESVERFIAFQLWDKNA